MLLTGCFSHHSDADLARDCARLAEPHLDPMWGPRRVELVGRDDRDLAVHARITGEGIPVSISCQVRGINGDVIVAGFGLVIEGHTAAAGEVYAPNTGRWSGAAGTAP